MLAACACARLLEARRLSKSAIDKTERIITVRMAMIGSIIIRALPDLNLLRELTREN